MKNICKGIASKISLINTELFNKASISEDLVRRYTLNSFPEQLLQLEVSIFTSTFYMKGFAKR